MAFGLLHICPLASTCTCIYMWLCLLEILSCLFITWYQFHTLNSCCSDPIFVSCRLLFSHCAHPPSQRVLLCCSQRVRCSADPPSQLCCSLLSVCVAPLLILHHSCADPPSQMCCSLIFPRILKFLDRSVLRLVAVLSVPPG
jgi:hypothetical protein